MKQRDVAKIRDAVRECLLRDWDPICVSDCPEAHDEYDSYVRGVCSLLLDGADSYKLRQYLMNMETVSIGLSRPSGRVANVVSKLMAIVGK